MGKLVLFCVAVSVLCSLLTADDIPVDPKFDPKMLSGKWYPLLTYVDTKPTPQVLFALKTKPSSGGGFSAEFKIPKNGTCQELKFNFRPLKPGAFQSEDGKASIFFIETDYTEVLYCVFKMGDQKNFELLGKKLEIKPAWKQKFQNFAKRLGFKSGEVKDISHAASCTLPPKKKYKV